MARFLTLSTLQRAAGPLAILTLLTATAQTLNSNTFAAVITGAYSLAAALAGWKSATLAQKWGHSTYTTVTTLSWSLGLTIIGFALALNLAPSTLLPLAILTGLAYPFPNAIALARIRYICGNSPQRLPAGLSINGFAEQFSRVLGPLLVVFLSATIPNPPTRLYFVALFAISAGLLVALSCRQTAAPPKPRTEANPGLHNILGATRNTIIAPGILVYAALGAMFASLDSLYTALPALWTLMAVAGILHSAAAVGNLGYTIFAPPVTPDKTLPLTAIAWTVGLLATLAASFAHPSLALATAVLAGACAMRFLLTATATVGTRVSTGEATHVFLWQVSALNLAYALALPIAGLVRDRVGIVSVGGVTLFAGLTLTLAATWLAHAARNTPLRGHWGERGANQTPGLEE